jgi:hypothetical protein
MVPLTLLASIELGPLSVGYTLRVGDRDTPTAAARVNSSIRVEHCGNPSQHEAPFASHHTQHSVTRGAA